VRKKWTDKERQFLKDNYRKMNNDRLGECLGATTDSVKFQLSKLGLKRFDRKGYEQQNRFIKENFSWMSDAELARELNLTELTVVGRRRVYHLRRSVKWTSERDKFLRDNHKIVSNLALSRALSTTRNAVSKRLSRLGLRRRACSLRSGGGVRCGSKKTYRNPDSSV